MADDLAGAMTKLQRAEVDALTKLGNAQTAASDVQGRIATAMAAADVAAASAAHRDAKAAAEAVHEAELWLQAVRDQISTTSAALIQAQHAARRDELAGQVETERGVLDADVAAVKSAVIDLQSAIRTASISEQRLAVMIGDLASASATPATDGTMHIPALPRPAPLQNLLQLHPLLSHVAQWTHDFR